MIIYIIYITISAVTVDIGSADVTVDEDDDGDL